MTSIPHPDPALFPGLNLPPAGDVDPAAAPYRHPPFSNRRLEQVHADVSLSPTTRAIALTLLRLPSARREAEYEAARRDAPTLATVQNRLDQAARFHELDKILPLPEAEQPVVELAGEGIRSSWWVGQPVEVRLCRGGPEQTWVAARLEEIDDLGRALVVHLDDGYRGLCALADLRPAPLPYLTIPNGVRP